MQSRDVDRIIEMAWEDRTPFDAIKAQFGYTEKEVITLMRRSLKSSSFKKWRARVQNRSTKHSSLRNDEVSRFKSKQQRIISKNKPSK